MSGTANGKCDKTNIDGLVYENMILKMSTDIIKLCFLDELKLKIAARRNQKKIISVKWSKLSILEHRKICTNF